MEVKQFSEKLNKVPGHVYIVEEEVQMINGIYEAELRHDNINVSTLSVYTGPKLTGNKIETYALSTPSLAPWKRIIRIHASVPVVYISYETDGDTVEADDINQVQEEITTTQISLNDETARAQSAEQELNIAIKEEQMRAEAAEQALADDIEVETGRSQAVERALDAAIAAEKARAEAEENNLMNGLKVETDRACGKEDAIEISLLEESERAKMSENEIADRLAEETFRAKAAENALADGLSSETSRSEAAENVLERSLNSETERASLAESVLAENLDAESARAKAAEKVNADAITTEVSRARAAEIAIQNVIDTNKPVWDDKYTRNEIDNKFSTHEMEVDWKESVSTYADISKKYPAPDDGWTVNVKDSNYTYRWSGTEWIAISANAIPKATQSIDGLLSKEDKILYDDSSSKKHEHGNKSIIDKITQTLLDNWNAAYCRLHEHGNKSILDTITQTLVDSWNSAVTHITDAVKHITSTERTNWNSAVTHISDAVKHITATERTNWDNSYNMRHEHGNKSILDSITQTLLNKWNEVSNKVDKVEGKGLSTNDYTTDEKNKLAGIASEREGVGLITEGHDNIQIEITTGGQGKWGHLVIVRGGVLASGIYIVNATVTFNSASVPMAFAINLQGENLPVPNENLAHQRHLGYLGVIGSTIYETYSVSRTIIVPKGEGISDLRLSSYHIGSAQNYLRPVVYSVIKVM